MIEGFQVDYFSDKKYNFLTAEISYKGQILCQINQDLGKDKFEIEFFHEQRILEEEVEMKFLLEDFLDAISQAIDGFQ